MTLAKIQFKPGINKEVTVYSAEGGWVNCDKVRFRNGYPEKLGGWVNYSFSFSFVGTARSMFNWVDFNSNNLLAVGTNQRYYIENGGQYFDITPNAAYQTNYLGVTTPTTLAASPFATTAGSAAVVVTDSTFQSAIGTEVTFSGASAINGIVVNGSYEIIAILSATTYLISTGVVASGTGSGGGSSVTATYKINAGSPVQATGTGYGVGSYGLGGYGTAVGTSIPLALWSQTNNGPDLIMNYRGGALYYWVNSVNTWNPAVTINEYANSQTKVTLAATWSGVVTAGNPITVPTALQIDIGAYISGTNITPGTYVVTTSGAGTTITLSAATLGSSSGNYTFSYSGQTAPTEAYQVVSSSLLGFTIAMGSTPYFPGVTPQMFNPLLVRWSDQSLPWEWTPTTYNQSGEQVLSNGSYIVGSVNTRQEILIWTDQALYSMQYIGPPYVFGFTVLMDNISTISPNCMITVNGVTYWMGTDKFYVYSGTVSTLPCTLRKFVFNNINFTQAFQVVCGFNERYNEIWWLYPSLNSNVNDSYVIFNYLENTWYYGTLNRTFWYDSSLRPYPMAAYSIQTSYLAPLVLVPLSASGTGTTATLGLPFQLSPLTVGDTITVAGMTPSGYNGTYTITAATTISVSYANATTGAMTVAGTVTPQIAISATSTTLSIINGLSYPNVGTVQIDSEQMTYTGANNNTLFGLIRGVNGTTATSHKSYQPVSNLIPNQILYHENGCDDYSYPLGTGAQPIISSVESADFAIGDGHHYAFVWRALPDFAFNINQPNGSTTQNPQIILTVYPRQNSGTSYQSNVDQPVVTGTSSVVIEQFTGQVYTRVRGRQMAFQINSNNKGVFWQMGSMRFDVRPDGRR